MKASLGAVLGGVALLTACSSIQQAAASTPASGFLARDSTVEQRQVVANALYSALRERLERDLQLVERRGPGTMVISTAFTEARAGGDPVLSSVSTFVPVTRLVREGTNLMTGSDSMVGGAAGEMRVTDSETGQLLAAAIDSRDATAGARVRTSQWDDVQTVARHWATQTAYRVCRLQQRPNCQTPT